MANWIHRLFNPHCDKCQTEKLESQDNEVIAVLREELRARDRMLEQLITNLTAPKTVEQVVVDNSPRELIRPNSTTWRVKRQMLEAEDRAKAEALRKAAKPDSVTPTVVSGVSNIEDIEKELGVHDDLPKIDETTH